MANNFSLNALSNALNSLRSYLGNLSTSPAPRSNTNVFSTLANAFAPRQPTPQSQRFASSVSNIANKVGNVIYGTTPAERAAAGIGAGIGSLIPTYGPEDIVLPIASRMLTGSLIGRMIGAPQTGQAGTQSDLGGMGSTQLSYQGGTGITDFARQQSYSPFGEIKQAPVGGGAPPAKTQVSNLSPGEFKSYVSDTTGGVGGGISGVGGTTTGGTGMTGGIGGGQTITITPGYTSGGVGVSGQQAPVAGSTVPPPKTDINTPVQKRVGQFEAMIKELQKLSPGGYVQTPLAGATGFGPAYAGGRAIQRMKEYQGMYR